MKATNCGDINIDYLSVYFIYLDSSGNQICVDV